MKHLTRDVRGLIRNKRLLACYVLIVAVQTGLGFTTIHKAKQGTLVSQTATNGVHVVKDVTLIEHDFQELLLDLDVRM